MTTDEVKRLEAQLEALVDAHKKVVGDEENGTPSMDSRIETSIRKLIYRRIVYPLIGLVGAGITYGTYRLAVPTGAVEPAEVQATVKASSSNVQDRVERNERKIRRLGDLHFKQRKLILDQGDEIREKLDAISPAAAEIPQPEEVKEARAQVEAWEQRKRVERSTNDLKQGDPFAGLEEKD